METIRVAIAQINVCVGDLKFNKRKIIELVSKASSFKADIVTFPELALCGYPPEDLLLKKHFIRDNLQALKSIQRKIEGIVVILGFVDMDKSGIYNAAAVLKDRKVQAIYHKIELPNYGVFDEKRYFQAGNKIQVFSLNGVVFGINICEDMWRKDIPLTQSKSGAKFLINISASPYHLQKIKLRKKILAERAKEAKSFIIYNNLVGGQDELVFDGASMVINPQGKEVFCGKQFEEDLVMADLVIKAKKPKSKKIISLGKIINREKPFIAAKRYKKLGRIEEIYRALVLGAQDYIKKNNFKKVVLGLSGGIDSSLTAKIACDAIGNANVIGVSMPSLYSSGETIRDARILAENLGIKLIVIPINEVFYSYLKVLDKEFSGLEKDVAEENLQARIRGNLLMAFSNKFGWLVLTTGNKSELSCGYCTLYGDMAGGFAVIKDVPKTMVYKLAEYINEKEKTDIIPKSILAREPSAELGENQKDSDTLPSYPLLDRILKKYVEEDKGYEKIIKELKFSSNIIKDVIERVDKNEYKRRQAPVGVKITPKAFGKDRRLPITNRYVER